MHVRSVPAIVWTTDQSSYARGVVRVRPASACMVYVHEFIHHVQWEHGQEATHVGDAMWYGLEVNARKLTRDAIEHGSTCAEDAAE